MNFVGLQYSKGKISYTEHRAIDDPICSAVSPPLMIIDPLATFPNHGQHQHSSASTKLDCLLS